MARIPIAVNLESRNGSTSKDSHAKNCTIEIIDPKAGTKKIRKRPGCSDYGLVKTGVAQLLYYWNGIKAITGDFFNSLLGSAVSSTVDTWNPADKSANITLSNGNLTATVGILGGLVRSVLSTSSLARYFEVTVDTLTAIRINIGVANASAATALTSPSTNDVLAYQSDGATAFIVKNNVNVATVATFTVGDKIGVLYDSAFSTVTFYKNGVLQYQATNANVPTGALFPATIFATAGTAGATTTNFGATAFTYLPTNVTSTNLSSTTASLPFSAQDNGANAGTDYLMFKNASQAWTITPSGVPTLITDADYPGISTVNVTGITRSGATATATTPTDTNFQVGSAVTIAGAVQADYNGVKTITAVTASNIRPAVEIPITITRSGTTATATSTTMPHGFINAQVVPIQGANQPEYNGDKTITWISATQFSFTVTVVGTDISTPAGGSPIINPYNLLFNGTNTVGAPTVFACSYVRVEDQGSLINGQTFTVNALAMGVCTVSAAAAGGFTLTSTGFGGATPGTFSGLSGQPTSPTVSSITSASNIATVTTSAAHNYITGKNITISGATPIVYNGPVAIMVLSSTTFSYVLPGIPATPISPATGIIIAGDPALITGASFTYTVANAPATPATGTITATGGRNTVPGIGYLNGPFYVMDINAVIYNSKPDRPAEWDALDYTIANNIPGAGVALGRSADFLIAFKEWSTEPYYDAKNAVGSPLSPYESGRSLIGCANGWSMAQSDGRLFWIAQVKEQGRSVYTMNGIQQAKISSPDVDRILNAATLTTVYAYGLKLDGHALYVLTLATAGLTLVYDMSSQHWYLWTSYTLGATIGGTITITRSGTTATYTSTIAHGVADGEPALISGCTQAEYNGIFQTQYVSTTSFTFEVTGSPATPATGSPVVKPYTESYFKFTQYASCAGLNLMLHESDGHLYLIDSSLSRDAGIPINYLARSQRLDGNTSRKKTMGRITLIGDIVADTAMVRWSDDDYATNRPYRIVNLAEQKAMVRQCGAFVERSIEVKHIGNTQPILTAAELEIQ